MSTRDIHALVFDLGGVIVDHDNTVMHRALAARCRAGWTAGQIAEVTADALWGAGRPVAQLHEALRRDAGYDGDRAEFTRDFCCHLSLNHSMLVLVERLAVRRRVMIFSNTNEAHWESQVAASAGRLGAFERHLSFEIGCLKPSPEAFAIVARRAGLAPGAMLFFDDVAANVEGALRAGFQAELFKGETRLRDRLIELGLDR